MRRLALALAGLGLTALAGCGGTSSPATSPAAAGATSPAETDPNADAIKVENMIADCMKQHGFQYIPHAEKVAFTNKVADYAGLQWVLSPPDQVHTFRAKYGFGVYSSVVYPNDPAVTRKTNDDSTPDPNTAIRAALDPARQKAYDLALSGDAALKPGAAGTGSNGQPAQTTDKSCRGLASVAVYGTGPTEDEDAARARAYAGFTSAPEVIAAAQKYGDCLRNKGYTVKEAQPGLIAQEMFDQFSEKLADSTPSLDTARAELPKEIKAALDDQECGTDYATLARTKYAKVVRAGGGVG
jgi:hypothetical protein